MLARFAGLAALLLLLGASSARADAIGPPDPAVRCPAGSSVTTNHCGTVCYADPSTCVTDAECPSGARCIGHALCVENIPCGGWGGTFDVVRGVCPGGTCARGACRQVGTYCATLTDTTTPREDAALDASADTGSRPDATARPDATPPADTGSPRRDTSTGTADTATDTGDGRSVTTYGCGCRAAGTGIPLGALPLLGLAVLVGGLARRRSRA